MPNSATSWWSSLCEFWNGTDLPTPEAQALATYTRNVQINSIHGAKFQQTNAFRQLSSFEGAKCEIQTMFDMARAVAKTNEPMHITHDKLGEVVLKTKECGALDIVFREQINVNDF